MLGVLVSARQVLLFEMKRCRSLEFGFKSLLMVRAFQRTVGILILSTHIYFANVGSDQNPRIAL